MISFHMVQWIKHFFSFSSIAIRITSCAGALTVPFKSKSSFLLAFFIRLEAMRVHFGGGKRKQATRMTTFLNSRRYQSDVSFSRCKYVISPHGAFSHAKERKPKWVWMCSGRRIEKLKFSQLFFLLFFFFYSGWKTRITCFEIFAAQCCEKSIKKQIIWR